MQLSNEHHDFGGKFASNGAQRERLLKIFQQQHNLKVSGIMDNETRELLQNMNKAASDDGN